MAADSSPLARTRSAKGSGTDRTYGLKLVGVGIQLTLLGGFVDELFPLVFVGAVVSLAGVFVR